MEWGKDERKKTEKKNRWMNNEERWKAESRVGANMQSGKGRDKKWKVQNMLLN